MREPRKSVLGAQRLEQLCAEMGMQAELGKCEGRPRSEAGGITIAML